MNTPRCRARVVSLVVGGIATALLSANLFAAAGDFYVAELNAGTVIRVNSAGVKTTYASGVGAPLALAFDPSGNLFVKDNSGFKIFKVTPAGVVSTFATNVFGGGLACDASGNIFLASSGEGMIIKYTPAGTKSTFATGLGSPQDVAFDALGNLYAADFTNGAVYKFTPDGMRITSDAGLVNPTALAFDRNGNRFIADSFAQAIYRVTPQNARTLFASAISDVNGMACDKNGALYVTRFSGGAITRFDAGGGRSTYLSGFSAPRGLTIEPPTAFPLNVSTRLNVQSGDKAAIAGVIIHGSGPKKLIFRGIGPSLGAAGVSGALQDTTLELYASNGTLVSSNDNWKETQQTAVEQSGVPPSDDRESAIVVNLFPGSLTAVLRGKNNTVGVGLIEVYDLTQAGTSHLVNISTRGVVGAGTNVLIGGFIVGGGNGAGRVIVRALGPSLANAGISGELIDPTLSIRDANGSEVVSNDDWRGPQQKEIEASGLQPTDNRESVAIATLPGGSYTAIVEGYQGATGVGLVEVYNVQ